MTARGGRRRPVPAGRGFADPSWPRLAVVTLIAAILLTVSFVGWYRHEVLLHRGRVVTGRVVEITPGGRVPWARVQFRTGTGTEILAKLALPPGDRSRVGDEIQVRYDPVAPHHPPALDGYDPNAFRRWSFTVTGIGALGAAIAVITAKYRRHRSN